MAAISIFSYFLIYALLASLSYRDLKEYILPDYLNAALALSFSAFHISLGWQIVAPLEALGGAAAGGGLLLLIRFLANKFYVTDSLGLGDVKLMAAAGIGLGYPDILMAITLGAFAGLIHGLIIACLHKKVNKEKISLGQVNVPAGPGLALGIAATMIFKFGLEWMTI